MAYKEYTTRAQKKQNFLNALKEVGLIMYACDKAGVSRTSYYRWVGEDREFLNATIGVFFEFRNDPIKKALIEELPEQKRSRAYQDVENMMKSTV